MPEKRCTCCKQELPLESFYKQSKSPDGKSCYCKPCTSMKEKERYRADPDFRKKKQANNRKYMTACSPEKKYKWFKKSYEKNKQKWRARDMVHYYTERGKLKKQPCQECGNTKSEAHHSDYSKPLEIIWLCKFHHTQTHLSLNK